MKIRKTEIPENSLLRQFMPADYEDTFVCFTGFDGGIEPDDVMVNFWLDFTWWIRWLFALRNFLVKFVGLEGSNKRKMEELEHCIRSGGEYGFCSVPAKDENETLLFLKDKHLDAYISIYVSAGTSGKEVFASTLVHYNRKLGKAYFFFIKPFHGIVVRSQLKRAVKNTVMEKQKC